MTFGLMTCFLVITCLSQEGSSYDRGLYARCFEELFDLANTDSTSTSQYKFSVTVFDLYNEQVSFPCHRQCTPFCVSIVCFLFFDWIGSVDY